MDGIRTTRRAASHGALNAAYNADGRRLTGPPPPSPPGQDGQPRSANTDANFLPLPGTLESMLKTTTETGDIGIFSIKPISSSATFHQLPRQRSGLWDPSLAPHHPRRSGSGRDGNSSSHGHVQDDRRRLPSYRDTTAEIISMYETESQRSTSSLQCRPSDDVGPRSYSLTSSASKSYHPRQTGTYHAGTVPPYLQRPRSPFPYPTRLKRPGVRPSSPALGENGRIDYSRMIGIDRVSYRTDYHRSVRPGAPPYGYNARRAPPLSLRPDPNRSMRSYSSQGSYRSQRTSSTGAPEFRDRQRRPSHPWGHHASEGSECDSVDSKYRNSSVGSIIDKYHHSSAAVQRPRNQHAPSGTFYYDYSEEFDNERNDNTIRPRSPLAPVPTHAPSTRRSRILDDGGSDPTRAQVLPSPCESANFQSDDGDNELEHYGRIISDYIPYPTTQSVQAQSAQDSSPSKKQLDYMRQAEALPHGQARGENEVPREVPDPQPLPTRSSLSKHRGETWSLRDRTPRIISEAREVHPESPLPSGTLRSSRRSEDASSKHTRCSLGSYRSSRLDNTNEPSTGASSAPTDDLKVPPSCQAVSASSDSTVPWQAPDGVLAEMASNSTPYDHTIRATSSANGKTRQTISRSNTVLRSESRLSGDIARVEHGQPSQHLLARRPRRNHGMMGRHLFDGQIDEDFMALDLPHPQHPAPLLLEPKPISPAKELRVRNSIPQLMKGLPGSTGDQRNSTSSSPEFFEDQLSSHAEVSPMSLSNTSVPRTKQTREPVTMDLEAHMQQINEEAEPQPRASKLKLRLSSPASSSSEPRMRIDEQILSSPTESCEGLSAGRDEAVTNLRPNRGRRLRLKVSKTAINSSNSNGTGTIKRKAGVDKSSSSGLDVSEHLDRDFFATPKLDLEEMFKTPGGASTAPSKKISTDRSSLPPSSKVERSSLANTGRGVSLDTHMDRSAFPTLSRSSTVIMPGQQSSGQLPGASSGGEGPQSRKGHGKRRFSDFKAMLSESLSRQTGQGVAATARGSNGAKKTTLGRGKNSERNCQKNGGKTGAAKEARVEQPAPPPGTDQGTKPTHKSRMRRKLSKLVRGAKHAVQNYVQRRRGTTGGGSGEANS